MDWTAASEPSCSACWSASEETLEHREMEATTTRERAGASAAVVDDRPRTAPVKEAGREPVPEKNGAAATPEPPEAPPGRRPNRWLILAILAPALILAAIYGARWLAFNRTHASTDDATVDGDMYTVNPKITGRILRVLVDENTPVKAGQLLVELDPKDIQ